jgi:hypothetical protein
MLELQMVEDEDFYRGIVELSPDKICANRPDLLLGVLSEQRDRTHPDNL